MADWTRRPDMYDVSSSYMEGRCCSLAKRGHNRDGKEAGSRNLQADEHSHVTLRFVTTDGAPARLSIDPRRRCDRPDQLTGREPVDRRSPRHP
jgi:hypothetical protein